MKIDLSTIFLLLLCVIPGLFAQRSRNLVCPRSFESQGATAEAGELVALGISTHGILICVLTLVLSLAGLVSGWHSVTHFFHMLDQFPVEQWALAHKSEVLLTGTLYAFASFGVSHWLGIIYGVWRFKSPVTNAALKKTLWLKRLGVPGLQGERPLVYEAFKPDINPVDGSAYLVFLEIELRDNQGFYSGQLSQFSLVKDEEPHKFVFLIKPLFKGERDGRYTEIAGQGLLLDLSEALSVRVIQTPPVSEIETEATISVCE